MIGAFELDCKNALTHLHNEFKTVRTGRASVDLLDNIMLEVYGSNSPLKNVASINVSDVKTLVISPWDKGVLGQIEKAIQLSDLGINPMNDGSVIRLVMPELNEERRKSLVKQVNGMGEAAKVSIRNTRQKTISDIKGGEMPEDSERSTIENIDEMVKKYNKEIDDIVKHKENDLMTV